MRRIVRDYVAAAIDRARPGLEQYIAEHLQYPDRSRLSSPSRWAAIREIRSMKIAPRLPAAYPPVDVLVTMRVSITARTRRGNVDLGTRTFAVDVEVDGIGAVMGLGYAVVPRRARLVAWWGG